jgi:hypothetical protein
VRSSIGHVIKVNKWSVYSTKIHSEEGGGFSGRREKRSDKMESFLQKVSNSWKGERKPPQLWKRSILLVSILFFLH